MGVVLSERATAPGPAVVQSLVGMVWIVQYVSCRQGQKKGIFCYGVTGSTGYMTGGNGGGCPGGKGTTTIHGGRRGRGYSRAIRANKNDGQIRIDIVNCGFFCSPANRK